MGDLVPTVVGGALSIAGGLVAGFLTVTYQFSRMQKARREERQDEALLELGEALTPVHVALARTLPQEQPYHVPPVMDLKALETHELGVTEVEGPEKWDEIAGLLYEVEKLWRGRLRLRIFNQEIRRAYGELREVGFHLARKDNVGGRTTAEQASRLLAQLRTAIEMRLDIH